MTYQDIAKNMIDKLPEDKMVFVINILENIGEMSGINVYPKFTPNAETIEAIAEVDEMIRTGKGEHFTGTTAELLEELLKED